MLKLAFILQVAVTLPRTEGQRFFRLIGCMLKSRPQSDGETVFKSHDAEVAWSAQAHFVQLEGCMYITCRTLFSLSDMNRCSNSAIDVARRCGYVAIASQKKWWMLFHTSTAGVFMWIYNVFFWSPSDLLLFGICTISFPFWLCLRNTFGVPKKDFLLAPKSRHTCVQFHVCSHKLYKSHTLHLQAHVSQTHVRSQRLLSGVQKNAQHNRIDLYINLCTVWCDEVTIRQCTAKKVKPVSYEVVHLHVPASSRIYEGI